MGKNEQFEKSLDIDSPRNTLSHHARHLLSAVDMEFLLAKGNEKPFDQNHLREIVERHVAGIRSIYDKVDPEKARILEDFCSAALDVPTGVDDAYQARLYGKFKEIEKIIRSL